jgi:hypothetical protein
MRPVFFFNDHPFVELRDELAHGIVQADLAFVHQHHDGGAGKHFRHRSNPENVVFADRFLRLDVRVAQQILVVNLPGLVGNDADDSRQLVVIQVRPHGLCDFGAGRWLGFCGERGCDQND